MATKLQELLDELKGLKEFSPFTSEINTTLISKIELEQLITKYTETTAAYKPGDEVRIVNTSLKTFIGTRGKLIRNTSEKIWSIYHDLGIVYFEESEFEPIS